MYDLHVLQLTNLREAAYSCCKQEKPLIMDKSEIPLIGRMFDERLIPCTGYKAEHIGPYSSTEWTRTHMPSYLLSTGAIGYNRAGLPFIRIHDMDGTDRLVADITGYGMPNRAISVYEVWEWLEVVVNAHSLSNLGISMDALHVVEEDRELGQVYSPNIGVYRLAVWTQNYREFTPYGG